MNLSPTPRRYASRSKPAGTDNAYVFSDPIDIRNSANNDRIIPEEYRLNSQMINRLIKQNKELIAKLDGKQEEIDRLNILVGSLRGKLIKYTEMNKKLEAESRVSSGTTTTENEQDYIQVPKRRPETVREYAMHDDRIASLNEKLDKLTKLVLQNNVPTTSSPLQSPSVAPMSASRRSVLSPSEEDIMCRESQELKQMEDQIDSLKRKLLIKRENELRKISLNQELLELMDRLTTQDLPDRDRERMPNREISHLNVSSPEHCTECHHQENHKHHHSVRHTHPSQKGKIPASNPLETPTPLPKKAGLSESDINDTINRVW